ncbi:hypothetical protein D3C84_371710 [compost metagenome]
MQPRHELVEALGQLAHLILAAGVDVNGEIPLAVGDVVQRTGHPAEILEQELEGASQHQAEHQDQASADERQLAEQPLQRRHQHILVHHHGQQPVGVGDGQHQHLAVAPADLHRLQATLLAHAHQSAGIQLGGQILTLLERQLLVRVGDDKAALVQQHGVAVPLHPHRQHILNELIQRQVGSHHPHQAPLLQHRLGQGHHQLLHGHADVGLGDDESARLGGILVPGALARVIVALVEGGIVAGHDPLRRAVIGQPEAAGAQGLLQMGHQLGRRVVGDHLDLGGQALAPVLHPLADPLRVGAGIVARLAVDGTQGLALQGIEGGHAEQADGDQHHAQAGCEQFAAKGKVHGMSS